MSNNCDATDLCDITKKTHWLMPQTPGPCLVHLDVRDKSVLYTSQCIVSVIDWSSTNLETNFSWRHKGPVTSQLIDNNQWPIYR